MRERLIEIAIDKFGKHGLEGASTRDIAAAADTAMSSITYHFGGKEGLYRAAAEHILSHLRATIGADPADDLTEHPSAEECTEAICSTLNRAATFMLRDESAAFALFISREQHSPSPIMRELMQEHMESTFGRLLNYVVLLRPDLDYVDSRATTMFLFGMATSLRHSRPALCLLMDAETLDDGTKAKLLSRLDKIVRVVLKES